MVRELLQEQEGLRSTFKGTVDRFGTKPAYKGPAIPTVCLKDVTDKTGKMITDHLWFTMGKQMQALNLQEGDHITFDARVTQYVKGYKGYREDVQFEKPLEVDYRLSYPTNVRKVEKPMDTIATYWQSDKQAQQAIVDKEKQAKLEQEAERRHMLIVNGKLVKPEDYPCNCSLQNPDQCFEEIYPQRPQQYSVDEIKAQQCFCPCHTYFEPF